MKSGSGVAYIGAKAFLFGNRVLNSSHRTSFILYIHDVYLGRTIYPPEVKRMEDSEDSLVKIINSIFITIMNLVIQRHF